MWRASFCLCPSLYPGKWRPDHLRRRDRSESAQSEPGQLAALSQHEDEKERRSRAFSSILWNGKRLTISSGEGLLGVIGRGIGVWSAHIPGTTVGYSDLSKATEILFWEMRRDAAALRLPSC